METCERCGYLYHIHTKHSVDDCVEELQAQVEKFKNTFKVRYNRNGKYPACTKMVWFQIDGIVYQGGYDDEKQLWFSEDGEEWSDLDDVYWMYMLDLRGVHDSQ